MLGAFLRHIGTNNARKDALTKEPLDLEEEDEARKFETSKWLENHFGTEFKSSYKSVDAAGTVAHLPNTSNTSYINVTMKSCCPPKERDYENVQSSRPNKHQQQRVSKKSALITEYSSALLSPPTSPPSSSEYYHGISEWSERHNHHRGILLVHRIILNFHVKLNVIAFTNPYMDYRLINRVFLSVLIFNLFFFIKSPQQLIQLSF